MRSSSPTRLGPRDVVVANLSAHRKTSRRPWPVAWLRSFADVVARAVILAAIDRATRGSIEVVEQWRRRRPAARADEARVLVTVRDRSCYRELFTGGSVGLGRSYVAGSWECDDLVGLIRLATRSLPGQGSLFGGLTGMIKRLRGDRLGGVANDPVRDRADVQAHYDLGDDFFSCFLDPTLTYSCGIFESPASSMEQASLAKLDRICTKLGLGPGDEVLEIGSGWGSFALRAARRYGCRVTTTTISDRQFATATRRIAEAGLDHLVTVLDRDYRFLEGSYDRLVSIEMIEAIGWRQQDQFFELCADRLRPGGKMALQAIVIDERLYERAKHEEDFIKAMVFPGSSIPSVASITAASTRAGLVLEAREDIGLHYVETLARWREAFNANREELADLGYGAALLRLWDLYLAYCQAGFAEQRIGDVQLVFSKPKRGSSQLARDRS